MDGRPEPNRPNGLLAALVPYHVLVQPEVALTRALWWLLGLENAGGALDPLIRRNGLEPEPDGVWLTEVIGEDLSRTDLEYRPGSDLTTQVVVEAKIGHTLEHAQMAAYRNRLPPEGGLLVVLVPEARRLEGDAIVRSYRKENENDSLRLDVWTYDDVIRCLEDQLPDSSDVAQFKGLVQASGALDIFPFEEAELIDSNDSRKIDILKVFDRASYGVYNTNLPSGSDSYFENRRYVVVIPYQTSIAVGVGRKAPRLKPGPRPWVWLRIADTTQHGRLAQTVLEQLRPGETERDDGGLLVPLQLVTHAPSSVVIQQLRSEIEEIGNAIRESIDTAFATYVTNERDDLEAGTSAVLGIQPLTQADLLDNSDARFPDVELMVREAAKSLVGRLGPRVMDDAFTHTVWLRIEPFASYIGIAFGRKQPPTTGNAQPWAWLRVHELSPHAPIMFDVLEREFLGQVARDDSGRAVPIDIPTGKPGPNVFLSVHRQLEATMSAIRSEIRAVHRNG